MSVIRKFIKKLEDKYNININLSTIYILGSNHAIEVDERIEYLCLFGVKLNDLQDLLPIAENLKILELNNCNISNLDGIEQFFQLTELNLSFNPIAHELKKILKLENLKKLNIRNIELLKTNILGDLKHLEILDISNNRFTRVSGLNDLQYFKKLKIDNSLIKNINDICSIDSLEHLSLSQSDLVKLDGLEKFQNLKELNLFFCNISKVSKFKLLPKLEKLDLSFTQLSDITDMGELSNLKELYCKCTQMTRIKGLDGLVNLELLDFSGDLNYWCGDIICIDKIDGLQSLVNLKKLNLAEQYLKKIEGLEPLVNLELLELRGNKISVLENIPFNNLKGLNISYNNLSEVTGDMIHMEELLLIGNNIKNIDTEWLNKIEGKCFIDLSKNPLEKIPPVPENITIKKGNLDSRQYRLSNWNVGNIPIWHY